MYTTHYDQSLCASGFCRRRAWLSKQLNISQHRLPCNQTRNQMYRREGNAKPTGTHSVNFVLSRSWLIVLTYTTGCSEKHWNAVRKFPKIALWNSPLFHADARGALENFYTSAQLHSLQCETTSKVALNAYFLYQFWCAQTYCRRPLFSAICTDLTLDVLSEIYRCTSTIPWLQWCGGILFIGCP